MIRRNSSGDLRARFQQESRLAAQIDLPHLVDIHPGYQARFRGKKGRR
jgi:hypothetical protein